MTKLDQVYVCPTCGNKVKVVEAGGGTLVCCGSQKKRGKRRERMG